MPLRLIYAAVLVAGLAIATSACGGSSSSSSRSFKAFNDGAALYAKGEYPGAAAKFEESIAQNPEFGLACFYLGHSFDSMYEPDRRGEKANDSLLAKAAQNYRRAIDTLAGSEEPEAAQFRQLSIEYLIAIYGSDKLDDFGTAESVAKESIADKPNEPANYQLLARLYEEHGDYERTEATLLRAIEVNPKAPLADQLIAQYYDRQGDFSKTMAAFQARAELESGNPEAWHTMGVYYFEKAYRDTSLSREEALRHIQSGNQAEDKALAITPDYLDAISIKSLLLALQANKELSPVEQLRLLAEAEELRNDAMELQIKRGAPVPAGTRNVLAASFERAGG